MPGLYSHTTRATGTVLTATIYNGDHENHITNQTPAKTDDYSATVTEMRVETDPGEISSESLATSLDGEIARLRYAITDIKKFLDTSLTRWYQSPTKLTIGGTNANSIGGKLCINTTTTTNMANGDIRVDSGVWIKDGITAPTEVSGYAAIYVDTADGDLKIKFGDGTVKTIVVDT